ncbi:MAG: c-type cytochrome [bacterium]|nr:c-type cytochrome [bacterium]
MRIIVVLASFITISTFLTGCGGGDEKKTEGQGGVQGAPQSMVSDPVSYDPKRGEGKFTLESLALPATIDASMAGAGQSLAAVKCTSCHKTTTEKLVGPGWKGVTTRRAPDWIMNFITNPDPMIDKDPQVQAMLELCLVRMPNQSLTDTDARSILEFMRQNDAAK